MKPLLDTKDIALLRAIQNGISLVAEPFKSIAGLSGLSEDEVIMRLKRMMAEGVIRRFCVLPNNRKLGLVANAMVVWKVPWDRIEKVGELFAGDEQVTHCYIRKTVPGRWTYNMFTVIHGYERSTVEKLVEGMSRSSGIKDYCILFSTREFKKTSAGRIVDKAIAGIDGENDNA